MSKGVRERVGAVLASNNHGYDSQEDYAQDVLNALANLGLVVVDRERFERFRQLATAAKAASKSTSVIEMETTGMVLRAQIDALQPGDLDPVEENSNA